MVQTAVRKENAELLTLREKNVTYSQRWVLVERETKKKQQQQQRMNDHGGGGGQPESFCYFSHRSHINSIFLPFLLFSLLYL